MKLSNQANVIEDITPCSGCFACAQICPCDAVSICENDRGHLYPEINGDKCIGCKKCLAVCPALKDIAKKSDPLFYGVRHTDSKILEKSSSGGLFAGLGEVIFSMGGVCYGAAYESDFSVAHRRVTDMQELEALQGSKYAMSNTCGTFRMVKDDLEKNIPVLYSGTSCIIAGLYSYLSLSGTNTEKLCTCDFICAGVPGGKILKDYISHLEKREKSICTAVNLRDKSKGWRKWNFDGRYCFQNGHSVSDSVYRELYNSRVLHRESCFDCPYLKPAEKPADITMGDFWGLDKSTSKTFYDHKGCSLAIIHSPKGAELLKRGRFKIFNIETTQEAMEGNRTKKHKKICQHEKFWSDYEKKGLRYCIRKYTSGGGIPARLRKKLLIHMKKW